MIIPVRCFTCNKVIANKWKTYETLMNTKMSHDKIFEKIGIERYCCKRMFVTHVELIDDLSRTVSGMKYAAYKEDADLMLDIVSESRICLDALESVMLDQPKTDQE